MSCLRADSGALDATAPPRRSRDMSKRAIDVLTATGMLTFVVLTLEFGIRLMAFHR